MADTAAHLVDRVLPEVPIRQWVLSLPYTLRFRLAYDSNLVSAILHIFVQAVFASLRRRIKIAGKGKPPKCGAVVFIQRFGDALNLNLHFHMLAFDGIYAENGEGLIIFHPAAPPSDKEMERVTQHIARRIGRLMKRLGFAEPGEIDAFQNTEPLLAELYGASTSGRIATGRRAGHKVTKAGDEIDLELAAVPGPCCANVQGVNLHAGVHIAPHDRIRLERLCRYVCRPPVALDRLSMLADGRLKYRLKRRWRDGTTHVIFEPLELIEKLAALVPAPQLNLVRYFGVLGASAGWRPLLTPSKPAADDTVPSLCNHDKNKVSAKKDSNRQNGVHPRRYSWAELLKRVFLVDVLVCPYCGGRMRILCAIIPPDAIVKILDCLGLSCNPPPILPAEPDRDPEFFLN
jgi:hypothetical protein